MKTVKNGNNVSSIPQEKQDVKKQKAEQIGIIIIMGIYIGIIFRDIISQEILISLGRDYLSFWSTAYLAFQKGWTFAFNTKELAYIQLQYIPKAKAYLSQGLTYNPIPAPYLPFFFLPLYFMIPISPIIGYIIWVFIKILVIIWYLKVWERRGFTIPWKYVFISYPLFADIYWGNYSFLLIPIIGEILYGNWKNKDWYTGIWLGVVWLKPSLVPFLLIYMLIIVKRKYKLLSGWLISTTIIWGISIGLGGIQGMTALFHLILSLLYSPLPTLGLKGAINWQSLVLNVREYDNTLSVIISNLGLFLYLFLIILAFKSMRHKRKTAKIDQTVLSLLFILAFAFIFSKHAHIHYLTSIYLPLFIGLESNNLQVKQMSYIILLWLIFGFEGTWLFTLLITVSLKLVTTTIGFINTLIRFLPISGNALFLHFYIIYKTINLYSTIDS